MSFSASSSCYEEEFLINPVTDLSATNALHNTHHPKSGLSSMNSVQVCLQMTLQCVSKWFIWVVCTTVTQTEEQRNSVSLFMIKAFFKRSFRHRRKWSITIISFSYRSKQWIWSMLLRGGPSGVTGAVKTLSIKSLKLCKCAQSLLRQVDRLQTVITTSQKQNIIEIPGSW